MSDGEVAFAGVWAAMHAPCEEGIELRLGKFGLGDGRVEEGAVRDLVEKDVVRRDLAQALRKVGSALGVISAKEIEMNILRREMLVEQLRLLP